MDKLIKYKSGYKYQLVEDYVIKTKILHHDIKSNFLELKEDGTLIIKKGYAWDGPSGPTIDTHTFMRGSLVHDALYQFLREKKLNQGFRLYADQLIRDICIEDGMNGIRAWYVYMNLRMFAKFAAKPKNKKEIKQAPKMKNKCKCGGC